MYIYQYSISYHSICFIIETSFYHSWMTKPYKPICYNTSPNYTMSYQIPILPLWRMFTHIHPNTWNSYKENTLETSSYSHIYLFLLRTPDCFYHILYLSFNFKPFFRHIVMILKPNFELSFEFDKYCTTGYNDSDLRIMILFW